MRLLFLFLLVIALGPGLFAADAPTQRVGLPLVITEHYFPGPELEPLPRRSREPSLVVRILEIKPAQDGFRYTFEVQGLDAGTHNLGDYLREANSEKGASAHQLPVTITTALPPGLVQPKDLTAKPAPRVGGYRALVWVLGIVWVAGLCGLIFYGKKKPLTEPASAPTPSVADRLKPLLSRASQEKLTTEEQAQVERLILSHWREKISEVADLPPAEALRHLRSHPEAAPVLLQVERWLHAPNPQLSPAELDELLAPYRA